MNIIAKISGKNAAGYAIVTRAYHGRELQSGPTYATRSEAQAAFTARRFQFDPTARIVAL